MQSAEIRSYESIIVLDGGLNLEGIQGEVKKVETILQKRGATNVQHADWGKRAIAYPLQKQSTGHYFRFEFETTDGDVVQLATAELLLSEAILKMQTHKLSERRRKFKGNPNRAAGSDDMDEEE